MPSKLADIKRNDVPISQQKSAPNDVSVQKSAPTNDQSENQKLRIENHKLKQSVNNLQQQVAFLTNKINQIQLAAEKDSLDKELGAGKW